ncbi:ADP-ribosylglycohydrolase family protein [Enterococcus sp. 669A]|uniref:ADP-ribosylglycohydrolase family protein n=1 Tax=Candidatus Enterococcus moelleringii TaxID=2815325 RepID=A0ABS3LAJ8_9ENTE|nr:ADP-ribosylglycohydrolase family protein [Enterococcus sp. 669A]MBO1305761.1 ADP-ribosylglycohydrolase family protein [Enterococcus sp. 669A]
MSLQTKIQGVLGLAAIGDAMGAATENLSFDQIRKHFGGKVTDLQKPGETAFALGNEAGQVTDDFSQVYFMSKAILKNEGVLDKETVIKAILDWSDVSWYFDRFAGPTTRSAVAMYKDPELKMKALPGAVTVDYASKATNGAAMKIAPAGILNPDNVAGAIEAAITITRVTHDNSLAISGACAIAAATSASLAPHSTVEEALAAGYYGAIRGETLAKEISREVAGPGVVERIQLAYNIVDGVGTKEEKLRRLSKIVGSGLHISEAVPCAFGIVALNKDSALDAVIDAVNIGYDTDTIATIVGTMVGAFVDLSDPEFLSLFKTVQQANDFDLVELSNSLADVVRFHEREQC